MQKKFFAYFIFLISIGLYGQTVNSKYVIENNYSKYFEFPRESIYVHFNKSQYVYGEDMWFKGYIYDRSNGTPALLSSNIYIDIYNENGALVKSELFLGYNGFLRGGITIDNTLTTGKYYVRAYTNWMKNFIEDDAYTTELSIFNETDPETQPKTIVPTYDVQFLPESGHALVGVKNNLGVKIINSQGKGIEISEGKIIVDNSLEINSFQTNSFGLGNVVVNYEKGKTYTAIIKLKSGQEIKKNLPQPNETGVNFNIQNLTERGVYVLLNKTEITKGDTFKLLIHKDGLSKSINIKFKDKLTANISISRSNLFEGINILTLFNSQNKPIAERMLYNYNSSDIAKKVKLVYKKRAKDSLQFNVSISQQIATYYNLSISVLPSQTKSYTHQDNIISNFKLLPYLKGHVENPKYYFTNIDRKKIYDLDLLLLTQGWSRYSWDHIFNNKLKKEFKFEYGLSLTGKVVSKDMKVKSVTQFGLRNSNPKTKRIDTSSTFRIDNIFPENNELIQLTFGMAKIKKKKGINVSSSTTVIHELKYLNVPEKKINVNRIRNHNNTISENKNSSLNTLIQNNNVFLNTAFIETEQSSGVVKKERLGRGKSIIIDELDYNNTNLINIIRDDGFIINEDKNTGKISILTPKTNITNTSKPPLIYIDDALITDLNILPKLQIELIDEVLLDQRASSGSFLSANNGEIRIYSRKSALPKLNKNSIFPFYPIKTKKGFTPYKEFYNPKYAFYSSSTYKSHGVIHWFSDVVLFSKQKLKIPDFKQEIVNFYIEGMSDTGELISEMISIKIPDNK